MTPSVACELRNFQTAIVSKQQRWWIIEMGHFVHIPKGNFVKGIITYSLIAFSRKREFGENKTKNFVENWHTLI